MKKRILCLSGVIVLAFLILFACKKIKESTKEDIEETETIHMQLKDEIPKISNLAGGFKGIIIASIPSDLEIVIQSEDGEFRRFSYDDKSDIIKVLPDIADGNIENINSLLEDDDYAYMKNEFLEVSDYVDLKSDANGHIVSMNYKKNSDPDMRNVQIPAGKALMAFLNKNKEELSWACNYPFKMGIDQKSVGSYKEFLDRYSVEEIFDEKLVEELISSNLNTAKLNDKDELVLGKSRDDFSIVIRENSDIEGCWGVSIINY